RLPFLRARGFGREYSPAPWMGGGRSAGEAKRSPPSCSAPRGSPSWSATSAAVPARSTWSPKTGRRWSSSRCAAGAATVRGRRASRSILASGGGWRAWRGPSSPPAASPIKTCGSTSSASASTTSRPRWSICAARSTQRGEARVLDIRLIRAEPEQVKARLATVGVPASQVDELLEADRQRRDAIQAVETLRAERTKASKAIRGQRDQAARGAAIAAQRGGGERS